MLIGCVQSSPIAVVLMQECFFLGSVRRLLACSAGVQRLGGWWGCYSSGLWVYVRLGGSFGIFGGGLDYYLRMYYALGDVRVVLRHEP